MRILWCAVIAGSLALVSCAHNQVKPPAAPLQPTGPLGAPTQIAPPNDSHFTNYPRTVRFAWSPAPKAATYGIEIDCFGCCAREQWCSDVRNSGYIVANVTSPAYSFDFWGDQRGRWRVWAVDAQSQPGVKSAWFTFSFATARGDTRAFPAN